MKKVALFAFNGDEMCFVHVLLNALDFYENGYETKIIMEGSATRLVYELGEKQKPFSPLFQEVKEKGLIDCVCKACATKMGVLESVKKQNLPLADELKGHPSIHRYVEMGFQVLTF